MWRFGVTQGDDDWVHMCRCPVVDPYTPNLCWLRGIHWNTDFYNNDDLYNNDDADDDDNDDDDNDDDDDDGDDDHHHHNNNNIYL